MEFRGFSQDNYICFSNIKTVSVVHRYGRDGFCAFAFFIIRWHKMKIFAACCIFL